jgi:hypothetical protein
MQNVDSAEYREQQLRAIGNEALQWVFLHLVQELRTSGVMESPHKMLPAVQTALFHAQMGVIGELVIELSPEPWVRNFESDANIWVFNMIFGDQNLDGLRAEIEKWNAEVGSPFALCGSIATKQFLKAKLAGISGSSWLEKYEGMFAAMARLNEVIKPIA